MATPEHETAEHEAAAPSAASRGLVARLDYPMFVATGHHDGEDSGCLIGFATQCSIEPFRFLACISDANHTYRIARDADCHRRFVGSRAASHIDDHPSIGDLDISRRALAVASA